MDNKEFVFSFKDENTEQKFRDYVNNFAADKELNQKIEEAESEDQVYELLKERNLINMDFQEFMSALDLTCEKLGTACDSVQGELSPEELEGIVGGGIFSKKNWSVKNMKKILPIIPYVGDLTVTAIEIASGEVKGKEAITCDVILGLGGRKLFKLAEIMGIDGRTDSKHI